MIALPVNGRYLAKSHSYICRVKEEMNILHTLERIKARRICHILQRNCLLKHGIEGKIEVKNTSDGKTMARV